MNNKLHLLFNHTLTPEQVVDARNSLGVSKENIKELPDVLKQIWQNIPPEINLDLPNYLQPLINYFSQQSKGDYVLVQGDFGAIYYMVNQLKKMELIPVYATTKRQVIEVESDENKIVVKRVFKHICYRKYQSSC